MKLPLLIAPALSLAFASSSMSQIGGRAPSPHKPMEARWIPVVGAEGRLLGPGKAPIYVAADLACHLDLMEAIESNSQGRIRSLIGSDRIVAVEPRIPIRVVRVERGVDQANRTGAIQVAETGAIQVLILAGRMAGRQAWVHADWLAGPMKRERDKRSSGKGKAKAAGPAAVAAMPTP